MPIQLWPSTTIHRPSSSLPQFRQLVTILSTTPAARWSAEDGSRFIGRARTLGSIQTQTTSDSSLQASLLNEGNRPNHPAAAGAEPLITNGRHSEVDSAAAAAGGLAHDQGLVVFEEEIQKFVAMGFDRTQVEVAVAAADGNFDVAMEILVTQLG